MEGIHGAFPKPSRQLKELKFKLQSEVLALLDHISVQPGLESVHKPDVIYLLEQNL